MGSGATCSNGPVADAKLTSIDSLSRKIGGLIVTAAQKHKQMLTDAKAELDSYRSDPVPPWHRPNPDGHLPGGPCCRQQSSGYCWDHSRLSFFDELVQIFVQK